MRWSVRSAGLPISALAVIASVLLGAVIPFLRLVYYSFHVEAWPTVKEVGHSFALSLALNVSCFLLELLVAVILAKSILRLQIPLWTVFIFLTPLFFGPTVCGLLWKLLLNPGGGFADGLLRELHFHVLDWTQGWVGPPLVFALIQIWTWGFVAASVLVSLTGEDTRIAETLYLLDGGSPERAFMWSLKATRGQWLFLLVVALTVENLRAFEVINVLGSAGRSTDTLAYLIFKSGYQDTSPTYEAAFGLVLLGLNAFSCQMLLFGQRKWGMLLAR